jgi:transcriptional regulator GlxA family with amidase domain
VEQLAQKLGVGRVTLFRVFRDRLRTTPAAHIDEVRNQRALFLLSESNLGLKDIASFCGFSSAQYFSSWFVRKNGEPPSACRNRIRRERGLSPAGRPG